MTYTPTVRKPTGIPAAPLIIVSGLAKSGKSLTAYKIAYSDLIDHCWIADLGEGTADEYGDPEVHDVLEWGVSWRDLSDTVAWCSKQTPAEGKMNAVIIDSGTEVWNGLKDRASARARASDRAQAKLKADPDAEIDVPTNYWNDAKTAWGWIINPLKLSGNLVGIVIVRQEIVSEFVNDRPTKNKVVSYQCEKTLQGAATAHININMDHEASLIEVRSKTLSVPKAGMRLESDNPIEEVIRLLSPTNSFAAPDVRTAIDDERDPDMAEKVQELWAKVKAAKGSPLADLLKAAAAEHGRMLTERGIADDLDWFVEVRSIITNYQEAASG